MKLTETPTGFGLRQSRTLHADELAFSPEDGRRFSLSPGDHKTRSVRLLWGNKLVAGLGSHWAGVRASFSPTESFRLSEEEDRSLEPALPLLRQIPAGPNSFRISGFGLLSDFALRISAFYFPFTS